MGTFAINNPEGIKHSFSKSNLYNLFRKNKLPVRKTFIISPDKYTKKELKRIVSILKEPFVLSQEVSSLENGIVLNARETDDITGFLENYPTEDCLASKYVNPAIIENKIAWFRVIYSCGKIFPHWWDPQNKFYRKFKNSKKEKAIKKKLEGYIKKIAKITKLGLFSTEFIINQKGEYLIIDYANNPIDLSSQDYERDGVPQKSLVEIATAISDVLGKDK